MTPNVNKQSQTRRKNFTVLGLIILAAVIVVAAVLILNLNNRSHEADNELVSDTAMIAGQTEDGMGDYIVSDTSLEIETPIGKLTFSSECEGNVVIEDTSSAGKYGASFYAKEDDEMIFLFELSVGDAENGYNIGSVTNDDGNTYTVWINISVIEANPSWSEEKTSRINNMQSCVNDLIDQLHHMKGFNSSDVD